MRPRPRTDRRWSIRPRGSARRTTGGKSPRLQIEEPDDEMISSYCSKPSPVSSNRTSKSLMPGSRLTASSRNVAALAVPKDTNRPAAIKVHARFLISAPPLLLDPAGCLDYAKTMPATRVSSETISCRRDFISTILPDARVSRFSTVLPGVGRATGLHRSEAATVPRVSLCLLCTSSRLAWFKLHYASSRKKRAARDNLRLSLCL
jgi:hypothetical protein